jgi:hypothetical protein
VIGHPLSVIYHPFFSPEAAMRHFSWGHFCSMGPVFSALPSTTPWSPLPCGFSLVYDPSLLQHNNHDKMDKRRNYAKEP